MPIRSLSDGLFTGLAWLPFLAFLVFSGWFLANTVLLLEVNSDGTEHFLSNAASVDHWNPQDVREHQAAKAELERAAG